MTIVFRTQTFGHLLFTHLVQFFAGCETVVKGMGGAMDLVAGVGKVIVVMDHANKHGESKVLKECTLPLTGKGVVDRIITNLGVLDVVEGGLKLVELADGVTEEEFRAATEATLVN